MAKTPTDREVIFLWVPPELKRRLKAKAKNESRTMNAQCCVILWQAVRDGYRLSLED